MTVGRQVDAAAREFGFFQIVGHRLPPERIAAMVEASSEFFALPLDVKQQCTPSDPSINRGYAARGTEALSYSIGRDAPPDLFEAFNIGEDDVDYSDPFYAAQRRWRLCTQHLAGVGIRNCDPALVGYFLRRSPARVDVDRRLRRVARSCPIAGSPRSSIVRRPR